MGGMIDLIRLHFVNKELGILFCFDMIEKKQIFVNISWSLFAQGYRYAMEICAN